MTDNFAKLREILREKLKENEPLAPYTTFKIGGPARFFFEVQTTEELIKAVVVAQKLKISYFILSGGSNLLVSDDGFDGLIIKNKTDKIRILGYKGSIKQQTSNVKEALVEAESGVLLNRLVRFTLDEGLSGLEYFLGIPGTVGGGIYINAHYKDKFLGDHLFKAKILTPKGELCEAEQAYFHFGYDRSTLKKSGDILLSAVFKLSGTGEKEKLWQAATEILNERQKSQPQGLPSAGCVFKNITLAQAMRVGTPNHTRSTGFLVEAAGFKGKQIGQAQISPVHANFIVNLGGAKANDVIELMDLVREKVHGKFGITLEEEVVCLGSNFGRPKKS